MARRVRNVVILSCLVLTLSSALAFIACTTAAPTATPIPTPTHTPTFEQKRSEVLRYVRDYNKIDNDLGAAGSQVQFPESTTSAEDLLAFNRGITSSLMAFDGALARLAELQVSIGDPATRDHKQEAIMILGKGKALCERLKQAITAGDQAQIAQLVAELEAFGPDASSVNRKTEQLMLRYNITDTEAAYRVRGE